MSKRQSISIEARYSEEVVELVEFPDDGCLYNAKGRIDRCNGIFPTAKGKRPLPWARSLHRDYLILAEADDEILRIRGRPHQLAFCRNGLLHHFVPTFACVRGDNIDVIKIVDRQKPLLDWGYLERVYEALGKQDRSGKTHRLMVLEDQDIRGDKLEQAKEIVLERRYQ